MKTWGGFDSSSSSPQLHKICWENYNLGAWIQWSKYAVKLTRQKKTFSAAPLEGFMWPHVYTIRRFSEERGSGGELNKRFGKARHDRKKTIRT